MRRSWWKTGQVAGTGTRCSHRRLQLHGALSAGFGQPMVARHCLLAYLHATTTTNAAESTLHRWSASVIVRPGSASVSKMCRTLMSAPAEGLISAPSRMASDVMKRAAPTLVFNPMPRFTYVIHVTAVTSCMKLGPGAMARAQPQSTFGMPDCTEAAMTSPGISDPH